ncbi:MAG: exodeoxyribonuclease V subunit gamma [Lachnospiraceae bacterium]|nr:exodeoxyribonuclease V subunit gamma [Lachnospiraceae bacterium]
MSLQFIFGNSGSGKSHLLYQKIIEESRRHPETSFLVIVPEQFTMQTQRDLVMLHPDRGIMNIDVLSFRRLAHRVFEEVGMDRRTVLTETGKNLMIRRVAQMKKDELKILGARMNRTGYVSEVKSILSELMQYEVSDGDLGGMLESVKNRPLLRTKLEDIRVLYRAFLEYRQDQFMKPEELMTVLAQAAPRSGLLKRSMLAFDGFAGFTPSQLDVIGELYRVCPKLYLTVTIDAREDFFGAIREHELFAPSRRLIKSILEHIGHFPDSPRLPETEAAGWAGKNQDGSLYEEPIVLGSSDSGLPRFSRNGALRHLEQNLFRKKQAPYRGEPDELKLSVLNSPVQEVHFAARTIAGLVRDGQYRYRDIAVIVGDLGAYGNYVKKVFPMYKIPVFVDETRQLLLNPCLEFVRGALAMVEQDFSYETVFRFLRTGMAGLSPDEIDRLENYVIAAGIRGYSRWANEWTWCPPNLQTVSCPDGRSKGLNPDQEGKGLNPDREGEESSAEEGTEQAVEQRTKPTAEQRTEPDTEQAPPTGLSLYNSLRARFMDTVGSFSEEMRKKDRPLSDYARILHRLLVDCGVQQKLKNRENELKNSGAEFSSEYRQIYPILIRLLDEMVDLLGEDTMDCRLFSEILDAGLSEAKVGIIPPGIDQVQVGDIRRSRLSNIKILFFLGLNDGWVPARGDGGGIVSDTEREILLDAGASLAPSARENSYIQRFYLYQNLTKPQDRLYLSWCQSSGDGTSMRPSYLVATISRLFPDLKAVKEEDAGTYLSQVTSRENGMLYFLHGLQGLKEQHGAWSAAGTGDDQENFVSWLELYRLYLKDTDYSVQVRDLLKAAFLRGPAVSPEHLDARIARLLYGTTDAARLTGASEPPAVWMSASVTRLEQFAGCAFSHFASYGLRLRERAEYGVKATDLGTLFHGAIELFSRQMLADGCDWAECPYEEQARRMDRCVDLTADTYAGGILHGSARDEYTIRRLKRILRRTVWVMREQTRAGQFRPVGFEISFADTRDLDAVQVRLGKNDRIRLQGRIDRIDTVETEDAIYVKVVDYKSGMAQFDPVSLYYGLQMQLFVYLNAALEMERKLHPGKKVIPAGVFYSRMQDPVLDVETSPRLRPRDMKDYLEQARRTLLKKMRPDGLVNSSASILRMFDANLSGDSLVIPVGMKKDGTPKATSSIATTEQFAALSEYVTDLLSQMGEAILDGVIEARPFADRNESACDYCVYADVCGFDRKIPGRCEKRTPELNSREVIERLSNAKRSSNDRRDLPLSVSEEALPERLSNAKRSSDDRPRVPFRNPESGGGGDDTCQ